MFDIREKAITINEVVQEIEEGSVRFEIMSASTPKALLYRLESNPTLQAAKRGLALEPSNALAYLSRAQAIYARPVPEGYLHPGDSALAAYIFLIGRSPELAIRGFVGEFVTANRPAFRWASTVARHIAEQTATLTVQTVPPISFIFGKDISNQGLRMSSSFAPGLNAATVCRDENIQLTGLSREDVTFTPAVSKPWLDGWKASPYQAQQHTIKVH